MREQTTATLDQTTSTTTCPALVHRHCGPAFEPHSKWTKKWGLDSYNFDWNLGIYSAQPDFNRDNLFAFLLRHIADTFPFPNSCRTISKTGQSCILHPTWIFSTDKLHVSKLVTNNSKQSSDRQGSDYFQFTVDSWTTNIGHFTVDPPGSWIRFGIYFDTAGSPHLYQSAHARETILNQLPFAVALAQAEWGVMADQLRTELTYMPLNS